VLWPEVGWTILPLRIERPTLLHTNNMD
jgi:hypothetical protein